MLNEKVYLSDENYILPKASPSVSHSGLQKAKIHFLSEVYQGRIINPWYHSRLHDIYSYKIHTALCSLWYINLAFHIPSIQGCSFAHLIPKVIIQPTLLFAIIFSENSTFQNSSKHESPEVGQTQVIMLEGVQCSQQIVPPWECWICC